MGSIKIRGPTIRISLRRLAGNPGRMEAVILRAQADRFAAVPQGPYQNSQSTIPPMSSPLPFPEESCTTPA